MVLMRVKLRRVARRFIHRAAAQSKGPEHAMSETKSADVNEDWSRRVDVELFIVHPTMTSEGISTALGLEAHAAYTVGEQRMTPKGTPLQGEYADTRWRHCIRYELNDQWFADKITALVDSLAPRKAFLHGVRATGGTAQVIIQFFGDGYLGDKVPLATLAKMAELQLDFGIECFNVQQS